MPNEATINSSLSIRKVSGALILLDFRSGGSQFTATVTGTKGPVPGAMTATLVGVDIDFSELTRPALCHIKNLDATNFVTVGIWDPETNKFYPVDEILPGESYVRRLSRLLSAELGTGAGTTGPNTNSLRLKADTASVDVVVSAFEF